MTNKLTLASRTAYTAVAALLLLVIGFTALPRQSFAYGQVTSRGIKMSDSAPNTASATYTIKFTSSAAGAYKSVVIDFCTESPLYADIAGCTGPAAFNATSASLTSQTGTTGWAVNSGLTTSHHLVIDGATATAAAATAITLEVSGIHNPSTTGEFYARIYTYAAQTNDYSGVTTPGTVEDFGGDALSTAAVLTITAKVQEALTFCVYTAGTDCTSASSSALTLGDINGVLSDYTSSYTGNAFFDVGSNATGGVVVTMKGDTLKSGTYAIAAQGNGSTCVADSTNATTEQFGLRVAPGAGFTASDSTGPSTNFYNCTATNHDLNLTAVQSTYGDVVAYTTGPSVETQNTVEFNAKSSTTTRAGVYTANEQFIATGTY